MGCLIVARGLPEKTLERHIRLKRMLPTEHRGEASLLAKTPEEFVANLPDLYLDIAVDGVISTTQTDSWRGGCGLCGP